MDTIARGEVAEAQIDAFISRRDDKRRREEGKRAAHELWQQSVDRCHAREKRKNRAAWYGHHRTLAEVHASLAAEHERRAVALLEESS